MVTVRDERCVHFGMCVGDEMKRRRMTRALLRKSSHDIKQVGIFGVHRTPKNNIILFHSPSSSIV